MILADTTIWIDYLRHSNQRMRELLEADEVVMHPFVVGELALGHIRQRHLILDDLQHMPTVLISDPEEVLVFIERKQLVALGIGYVDTHLLTSALSTDNCLLWTADKRLGKLASRLGIAVDPIN